MDETLTTFMHDYCAAFRPGNADAVADFYLTPLLLVQADRPRVLNTREELVEMFAELLRGLALRDFQHSRIDRMSSIALGNETVLVSAAMTRYRRDGTGLEHLGATYTLIRHGARFRIAAVIAHAADRMIEFAS